MPTSGRGTASPEDEPKTIKCVVWDLDDTLWDGVLLEDARVLPRESAAAAVRALERRGILQSIASRNEPEPALAALETLGLREYFLYPQINWGAKSDSIRTIARELNLGLEGFAFVDDQPFERDEVHHALPTVLCLAPEQLDVDDRLFTPRFLTDESARRRQTYLNELVRRQAETAFNGPKEEFLASLGMRFTIAPAREEDLRRAEELTVRTNQLNSTGCTYSYDELNTLRQSPRHALLIAGLRDRYGDYGKIGLALIECGERAWTLKLLLMSCRVMSRGVGTILLSHLLQRARERGVTLRADFVPNARNRIMQVTYRLAGFAEKGRENGTLVLEHDLRRIQEFPKYVQVDIER